ncbi:hypothetical protein E2562_033753 [Oryza meyeriana var. granulata]|uniref:Uncharacterized protein n=1 Tax=Oryza meyeriana var. granulata TaxID=110450 RepID=A0A6G1F170_9ORYZ|nr:hypothetical protein E2562_033753 [Oryza meyeriana var. granulata]
MCAERRLVDVPGSHPDLVVAGTEVQFGEEPCAVEFVEELVHHRNGKCVLDGEGVQSTTMAYL